MRLSSLELSEGCNITCTGGRWRPAEAGLSNSVQRGKRAFEHVILEAFMSETLVWIDPGNHKYHMLAVERTCPIGAVIGGRAQTVHSAQRGRAGVRPPGGVDEP
jgi:hypothetical protein